MADSEPPTICLFPGAWCPGSYYQPLLSLLHIAGYSYITIKYPSFDPTDETNRADCIQDTNAAHDTLKGLIEGQGRDILIIAHSYGGVPAAGAAHGLCRKQRERDGLKGGVVGLIIIAGFLIPEGSSVAKEGGGDTASFIIKDKPRPGLCCPSNPAQIFAADIDDASAAAHLSLLKPTSTKVFFSAQPAPVFTDPDMEDRLGFVVFTEDQAIEKEVQYAMMEATGKNWRQREVEGSHLGPFWNQTGELAWVVEELMEAFQAMEQDESSS